jgi:hypothetical protein
MVVRTAPEETLWAEALDRLGSVRTGLVAVVVVAVAVLGVALWALLDHTGDSDREDANRVRVERLADPSTVPRASSARPQSAGGGDPRWSAGFQRRIQALETTVEKSRPPAQDLDEIAAAVEALHDSVEAVINMRGPYGLLDDVLAGGHGELAKVRDRYTAACRLCLDVCNSESAVAALGDLYADPDTRRAQTALQFVKFVSERQDVRRARAGAAGASVRVGEERHRAPSM